MTVLSAQGALGALRYEALMAVRRRILWYAMAPLSLLALLASAAPPGSIDDGVRHAGHAAVVVAMICVPGVAVALADRLAEGTRAGMGELLAAAPYGAAVRPAAMIAAPLGVALLPPLLVVLGAGLMGALADGGPAPIGAALFAFSVVLLPGAAAAAAFAALLGLLMPPVLARTAAALVWFWSTIATPQLSPVPTPTGTLLSPSGGYPAAAWAGQPEVLAHRFLDGPLSPPADTGWALANLAIVGGMAVLFTVLSGLVVAGRR
ncbi:hypothetical protein [Nocardiopsis potens]|uniref:hypothetical protein n=1 Tax=Nocardiopsis potens TaxID=1246458 RepID=UPI00034CDB25|nr:hypothetical protein [Nocardiopsis potens]